MTPKDRPARRPGRPRSAASHQAVLEAAAGLLDDKAGMAGFTVDEVARRSGVSKGTIYKHWSGALPIAAEAWGTRVTKALPVPNTGDAVADLTHQVVELAAFYASPSGRVIAQLLARGVEDSAGATVLREQFFATRRTATVAVIRAGMAAGHLRPDVDPELVVDLLFGPIVFRLFNGQPPMGDTEAVVIAEVALRGLRPSPQHLARPAAPDADVAPSRAESAQ